AVPDYEAAVPSDPEIPCALFPTDPDSLIYQNKRTMPPQASSADETDLSQEILSLLSQDAPGCVSYLHSFPENPAHPESSSSSDLPYMHLILIGSAHILLPVSFPA